MKYYALEETETVAYLGDFDWIDDAFVAAETQHPIQVVWVFSEEGLRSLQASIADTLKATDAT